MMKIKINIYYMSYRKYGVYCGSQWFFYFKKYKNIKGFILRIFGIYINIRERDALKKLIALAHK